MAIMNDGFSTIISFPSHPSIAFEEKTVTPPGVSGGGANDTTTMRNSDWRTRQPKLLKTLSDSGVEVAWDPAAYDDIMELINDNQLITITFPDSSTFAFYGWVDEFTPNDHEEGSQPTANLVIIPSNQTDAGVETAPVFTPAP